MMTFAKIKYVIAALILMGSSAFMHAQTITVAPFNCPTSYDHPVTVMVSWSAPTTDPSQVVLWEESYSNEHGGGGEYALVGSGYNNYGYITVSAGQQVTLALYDDDNGPNYPEGNWIAGTGFSCPNPPPPGI